MKYLGIRVRALKGDVLGKQRAKNEERTNRMNLLENKHSQNYGLSDDMMEKIPGSMYRNEIRNKPIQSTSPPPECSFFTAEP